MNKPSYADHIRDQIKIVEQKIAALNSELADLQAAQRVLQRFEGEAVNAFTNERQEGVAPAAANVTRPTRPGTIAEAVIERLRGSGPMESSAIINELQQTWRNDITSSSLLSTLSRMKAAGRIINKDRFWMLPQTEEASLESKSNDASKPDVVESHTLNDIKD